MGIFIPYVPSFLTMSCFLTSFEALGTGAFSYPGQYTTHISPNISKPDNILGPSQRTDTGSIPQLQPARWSDRSSRKLYVNLLQQNCGSHLYRRLTRSRYSCGWSQCSPSYASVFPRFIRRSRAAIASVHGHRWRSDSHE